MTRKASIVAIETYLPQTQITNEQLAQEFGDLSYSWTR